MQEPNSINYDLPEIDISSIECSAYEFALLQQIVHARNDGTTILRATRPKQQDDSRWIWRKVIQAVSSEEKFHAVTSHIDEYISNPVDRKSLDVLIAKILATIPHSEQHGIIAWSKATGVA